jgi:hypothetical protein
MEAKQLCITVVAIILTSLIAAWEFRYEEEYREFGQDKNLHRNRFTGVTCYSTDECWLEQDLIYKNADQGAGASPIMKRDTLP